MNDKVDFLSRQRDDYEKAVEDMKMSYGWKEYVSGEEEKQIIKALMNHGMDAAQAEDYCRKQREITAYLGRNQEDLSVVRTGGILISYGWK